MRGSLYSRGLFIIIVMLLLLVALRLAKADAVTNIVNITIDVNSTTFLINVSNNMYTFSNAPSVIVLQQNFTVTFNAVNVTLINQTVNQTIVSNVTCSNASISVSCVCPQCPSLPSLLNSSCSEVGLDNTTKSELYNHYMTNLGAKIEESSNKVAADVVFQLQPTKIQLDDCRDKAINSTVAKIEAERQRDTALSAYDVKIVEFTNTKKELNTLQVAFIAFMVVAVLGFIAYVGLVERKGSLYG